jgi:hypothetical protein
LSQLKYFLTVAMSVPNGAPWTFCVPWLVAPIPITVLTSMYVGLTLVFAAAIAFSIASKSSPSVILTVFQCAA